MSQASFATISIRRAAALWVCALLALLFLSNTAAAQGTHIQPKLAVETPAPAAGTGTTIALTMVPDAGWHGYWKNGGDAGFGLSVAWNAPEGVSVSDFAYPVPEPLILFGLMNHVYEHPYALLANVRVDSDVAPGTDLTLSGVADWLACTDRVCVPERAVISVVMTAGDGRIAESSRRQFDGWRNKLPQPLDRAGRWERAGGTVRFAIPLPAGTTLDTPYLFVATRDLIDYAAPQIFSRNGDQIIVETGMKGDATGGVEALLKLADGRGLTVRFDPGQVPPAGDAIAGKGVAVGAGLFWAALGGAIVGGLILNLMPCVFPILSLKALSLARSGGKPRDAKGEAAAYTAGAVLMSLLLGGLLLGLRAAGTQVGWAFQLQHPVSVLLLLVLAAAITLNLLGTYELPSFSGGQKLMGQSGKMGGFRTGALAAFVATPCSGPLLGAALGATLALPAWAALPIFGGLGLGLALPFLAIGFVPALRNLLPRPGPWMATFRQWMALPMGLTALALLWLLGRQLGMAGWVSGLIALLAATILLAILGRSQRSSGVDGGRLIALLATAIVVAIGGLHVAQRYVPTSNSVLTGQNFTPAALTAARATGKPVFVYFTADWCLSCKANEAGAIHRDATQAAFDKAGVITLVGDWTNGDAVITRTLAAHGRNSVPLYLWYAPGAADPDILPQILTPGLLTAQAAGR